MTGRLADGLTRVRSATIDGVLVLVAALPVVNLAVLGLYAVGAPAGAYAPTSLVAVAATALVAHRLRARPRRRASGTATSQRTPTWLLLAGGVVATLVLSVPILPGLTDTVIGGPGDPLLLISVLDWQWHALTSAPSAFFDLNIFAPERSGTLAWGPALTPYLLFFVPVRALTSSPIAGLNVSLIGVTALTIGVTYAFLRRLELGTLAAGVGAVLYAATWQRLSQVVHLESYATFWVPLIALLFLRVHHRARWRDGLWLGLALGGAFLGGPYYFVGVALALGGLTVLLLVRRRLGAAHVRALATAAVTTLVIVAPFVWFTARAGLTRDPADVPFATWLDPFSPGTAAPALLAPLQHAAIAGGATGSFENGVHPGVVLMVVAAVGAVVGLRQRRQDGRVLPHVASDDLSIPVLVTFAISGVVLALGPHVVVGGHRVVLPTALLWELPGLGNLRAPRRLLALPYLGLAVLGALGASRLLARMRVRDVRTAGAAALVGITLATSVASPSTTRVDVDGPATQVNHALADRGPGVVLELPWTNCPGRCLYTEPPRMVWSRYDRFPRLGGYSGFVPDHWRRIEELSVAWTNPDVLRELRDVWRVRYLILRTTAPEPGVSFTPEEAADLAHRLARDGQIAAVERIGPSWLVTLRPAG